MEQQETASIRFYTAGCMEFENYSECYENLTLAQAVDIYKKIRKSKHISQEEVCAVVLLNLYDYRLKMYTLLYK